VKRKLSDFQRDYPTTTGLLPVSCALGLHGPMDRFHEPEGCRIVVEYCQRCGSSRDTLGRYRARWSLPVPGYWRKR
jgi:hypothetical protein